MSRTMDATEKSKVSKEFHWAVTSLGGPATICVYSDVQGTLYIDGLNGVLNNGLHWVKNEGGEVHLISGGDARYLEKSLVEAGANIETLGHIEDKAKALSLGSFPQKPIIIIDDDDSIRRATERLLRLTGQPFMVLDPEKL